MCFESLCFVLRIFDHDPEIELIDRYRDRRECNNISSAIFRSIISYTTRVRVYSYICIFTHANASNLQVPSVATKFVTVGVSCHQYFLIQLALRVRLWNMYVRIYMYIRIRMYTYVRLSSFQAPEQIAI